MIVRRQADGSAQVWAGFDAQDLETWEARYGDEPAREDQPRPTLDLDAAEVHALVFELLRGPQGPVGAEGARGRGMDVIG